VKSVVVAEVNTLSSGVSQRGRNPLTSAAARALASALRLSMLGGAAICPESSPAWRRGRCFHKLLMRSGLDDLAGIDDEDPGPRCATWERRCAMAMVVRPLTNSASAAWIAPRSRASTLLVASSRIRIRGSVSSTRAMLTRWRSPPDRPAPRSPYPGVIGVHVAQDEIVAVAALAAVMTSSGVASGFP